jgi:hypothetical protein
MRLFMVLALLAGTVPGFADTLRLRSGQVINGTYLGGSARQVKFAVGDKIETYDVADVNGIEFQAGQSAASSAPAPAQANSPSPAVAPAPAPAPAAAGGIEIPAGAQLVVRMIDSVDSEVAQVGQEFRASLDEPIMVGGRVVVPRNSDVTIKLVEDKQAGRISGRTELTVDVVSMVVNGRKVDVNTQAITQSGSSQTKRTGTMAGGGAALGAIIGAVAGGGKGAAIGAVTGAGAGTAAGAMTKGSRVRIPSETRLTFTLQDPLKI